MRIALQNLSLYNEGKLLFTWLSLPATEEEFEKAFEKIRVGSEFFDECGNPMEEFMLGDWEFENDVEEEILKNYVGEYCNLEELNEMVEWCEDYDDDDIENAKIIHSMIGCGLEEALEDYVAQNKFARYDINTYVETYVIECYFSDYETAREILNDVQCYMNSDDFADFIERNYCGDYEMRIENTDEFFVLEY